jgi:flagellin
MAMVVKNNMSAVHTLNTLNKNSSALSKSLAKVSSGMKVNGAADDASGYAISERMRVQIRSLDQANANTQNGSSMMKTAEGAVSSTVDILKTLKEKVIGAANDDKTDSDRAAIQKELDQSIDQINDNANITYNGKYLVDGSHNQSVKETTTAMTNESLAKDTTGNTKFTDMQDRNGNSLNIQNLDTVNISFVKEGKTYTTSMQIKGTDGTNSANENLKGLLALANKEYAAQSGSMTVGEAIASDYNVSDNGATVASALDDAGFKWTSVSGTDAWRNEKTGQTIASTVINGSGEIKATAAEVVLKNDLEKADRDALSELSTAAGQAATNAAKIREAGYELNAASSAWVKGSNEISTNDLKSDGTLLATANATTVDSAYRETLGVVLDRVIDGTNTHSGAFAAEIGDGKYIGRDVAGDTVNTADEGNALTIKAAAAGVDNQISGITITVTNTNGQQKKSVNAVLDNFSESIRAQNKSADNAITLQVGAKAGQSIRVGLTDMRAQALGLASKDGKTLQVGTQQQANTAINVLDNAVAKALDQQTTIGSIESRLEYTSANLTTSSENVQSSESTIRDADMAKEMTEYTKNNVLLQAAQSMLAQANQNSSAVLSLLQ